MIEALMVVFKITVSDYRELINAFYLICGVSIIVVALSVFIYLTKNKNID
jgi:hypothetical protein